MEGFVRIIPKVGQEEYQTKLSKFSDLFHKAELEMVIRGHRKAATLHISQENLDRVILSLNENGLMFTPLRKSGYYQGFAHTHKEVKPGDPFYWYGCVTKTLADGKIFKAADVTGDHNIIGELLGFPKCCTEYFSNTFKTNVDPIWVGKEGDISGDVTCNQMLRYFGARITSHLSCHPECADTIKIGQKWLEVMKEIDNEATENLKALLSSSIIWDSYHGVVQVDTPFFIGLTHTSPKDNKPRIINWSVQ